MKKRSIPVLVLVALIAAALAIAFSIERERPENSAFGELPPIKGSRVLFILPHPDDEALAGGGLLSDLAGSDNTFAFFYLTNGESYQWAVEEESQHFLLSPADYISLGYKRQAETRRALEALGLEDFTLFFLSYPDGGLRFLWEKNWDIRTPLYSRQLDSDRCPYITAYEPQAPFAGESLLNNLRKSIREFSPTVVFAPCPFDSHSDHRATAAFTMLALEEIHLDQDGFNPQLYYYLTHRGNWPGRHGKAFHAPLFPPNTLLGPGKEWLLYPLSEEARVRKEQAILAHQSQMDLLGGFLLSFLRENELFLRGNPLELSSEAVGEEPTADTFWRSIMPNGDLSSICFSWDRGIKMKIRSRGDFPQNTRLDVDIFLIYKGRKERLVFQDLSSLPEGSQLKREGPLVEFFMPLEKKPESLLCLFSSSLWGMNLDRSAPWLIRIP